MADEKQESSLFSAVARTILSGPQQPTPGLAVGTILDTIAKNPQNRVYKDQTVYLDGYTFTNCCFTNCVLYTETGVFALKECLVMHDCRIVFGDSALRIVKLFNFAFGNPNVPWPQYHGSRESNGSVTIE